jgi:hypothetical protein
MGSDADGREKLKRARKLLGNAEINKSDSASETEDPTPPMPPAKETQAPVGDRSQPSQETAPLPPPPTTSTDPAPELSISSPVDQPTPVSTQAPAKPATASITSIEDLEADLEARKEFVATRKPQGKGREASIVAEAPLAGEATATSTVQPEPPSRDTAPTSMSPPAAETPNHSLRPEKDELIDSLPKTAWGVKVTMKDFVFIRDHDKYCVLLKDPRTFREKFVEWMRNLEASVTPELATAREVTLSARKAVPGPAPNNPDGDSGEHL